MRMKPDLEKLKRMYQENEEELRKLDEIEEGYHQNPNLELEKRVRLLLTVEETRQTRLRLKERLQKQIETLTK